MVLAMKAPERVAGVFFFACNMDPSGTKEVDFSNPVLGRCYTRHVKDYAELSATPEGFEAFSAAVGEMMRTEPNYLAPDLARIEVPVAVVRSENDEFIKPNTWNTSNGVSLARRPSSCGASATSRRCSGPTSSTSRCSASSTGSFLQGDSMATLEDVRRTGSKLPGAVLGEDGVSFGVSQKGKVRGFVWLWNERVHPKKARVPNPGVLAVATPGLGAKEVLLSSDPEVYFTEPHYNGFPAVLVRLAEIGVDELEGLLIEGWKTKASPTLVAEFERSLD